MLKEVSDQLEMLKSIHGQIDGMLNGLSEEQWIKKPAPGINNVASIIEHLALTEHRFWSVLRGQPEDIDTQSTFQATSWDVGRIRQLWADSLKAAESAFASLTEADLDQTALTTRAGAVLNKRQLIALAIAHAGHHRGQLPLIQKLLA
ncbi:MAG: DinB family protein [Alicyclobacillaceae bacterium]|nr:DinB family protein [Alicyclobacillaceae bacterium]